MKKNLKLTLFIGMITCLISIGGSYAATSYAISASKVTYLDNSNLGVDNVQAAIDGTCVKFSDQLKDIRKSLYPIGGIYMSTTDSTVESVEKKFGGTWEKYAEGTMLISANSQYKVNTKGGSSTVTLSKANIPSLSVSGTTNSTGSGYSIGYTYATRTTGTGNKMTYRLLAGAGSSSQGNHATGYSGSYKDHTDTGYPMASHTHNYADYYANSISGIQAHTHTFTGNYTNNSQTSVNIQNPYTAVYMYKRTA